MAEIGAGGVGFRPLPRSAMRVLAFALVLTAGLAGCNALPAGVGDIVGGTTGALEVGYDRNGSDYRSFGMNGAGAEACRDACRAESRCRAFTWTRPGYQDPGGKCWLKDAVPRQSRLAQATSGVVRP